VRRGSQERGNGEDGLVLFDTAAAAQLLATAGEVEPLPCASPTATGMEIAAQTAAVGGYTLDATFDAWSTAR
jgi:hypothetical protein